MTRTKTEYKRDSNYHLMSDLWRRWRKRSDIDEWNFARHLAESDSIFIQGVEFVFMQYHMTFGLLPGDVEQNRMAINNCADAMAETMDKVRLEPGNIILTKDITVDVPPSAPYHTDSVFKWEGLPVRIRTRPNGGHMQYHVTFFLGVLA